MKRYLQIIIGFMLAAMVLLTGCSSIRDVILFPTMKPIDQ